MNYVKNEITKTEDEINRLHTLINQKLRPLADRLRKDINAYRHYILVKNTYELYHQVSEDVKTTLEAPDYQVKKPDTVFKPREHFPPAFSADISQIAAEIMTKVNYRNLNTVQFHLQPFDLVINGGTKQEDHGKGYNSFINTVMGLTMRRYYIDCAKYKPGLFIVDTPFHGFDEGKVIKEASMIHGLFDYLISQNGTGQIIVVENGKNIPENIDFESQGVNVIDFHKDNYQSRFQKSRYGFLIGVTGK